MSRFNKSWIKNVLLILLGFISNNVFANIGKICISSDGPKDFNILQQKQSCDLSFYSDIYGMHFFKIRDRSNFYGSYVKILEIGNNNLKLYAPF